MIKDVHGRPVEIVTVDADPASPARLHLALRTLARLLVRQYREKGDSGPNAGHRPVLKQLPIQRYEIGDSDPSARLRESLRLDPRDAYARSGLETVASRRR